MPPKHTVLNVVATAILMFGFLYVGISMGQTKTHANEPPAVEEVFHDAGVTVRIVRYEGHVILIISQTPAQGGGITAIRLPK